MADCFLNLVIFLATPLLLIRFRRKTGKEQREKFRAAFRFFTCQSNILCSVSAFLMLVSDAAGDVPGWIWILKYTGTAAVTVTMLTVFLYLAPSVGKGWYDVLLRSVSDLFMHLLTPAAALVSFCVFEKRGMSFPQSLFGLLPVALYGPLYLYKVLLAPEGKRWKDFYGFNKNGRWPVMLAVMLTGTFLVCMGIMGLQNL